MTSGEHTKGADLLALADRVEKLTGPDHQIDRMIFAEIYGWSYLLAGAASMDFESETRIHGRTNYTASLDAAMTLVPGNWRIMRLEDMLACRWDVELVEIHSAGNNVYEHRESKAATPALALTAACLRARAQSREDTHG